MLALVDDKPDSTLHATNRELYSIISIKYWQCRCYQQ